MSDFLMPKLGADMTEGKLVAWRKQPGDAIRRGDIMAEVDTDKGVIDIEAFVDGVLESILVQPGETAPVGAPLARVRTAEEVGPPVMPAVLTSAPSPIISAPSATAVTSPVGATANAEIGRLRISPAARRRARELNVDPTQIQGTGRGGAITIDDIEHAVELDGSDVARGPSPVPTLSSEPSTTTDRSLRMRQAIAAVMSRANREIPHYYLSTTIDLKLAMNWLARENERRSVPDRLLYSALLLKATALGLREVPELNAFWQNDQLVIQQAIHLGVAISLRGGGLIAPAIHDADHKSLGELMHELRDLVARARAGGLKSSELADPTITVTNLGERGVESVFGVIYPPQVALVGFGRIVERPWCIEGQLVPRPLITATLAGDHRATDGHRGALFLVALERLLQDAEKL